MRAVRFDSYGPIEKLDVVDVEPPDAAPGRVVVEVVATSINPGESKIREGVMHERAPADFPSGQGSDLAGRIASVGEGAIWRPGEEVIGWTDERAAQAELVSVPAEQLVGRPPVVPWDQAASLYVAGCTARAMADAVEPRPGDTVVVAGATGGVGSILIQLLRALDTEVIGIAGSDSADWLAELGVEPVPYGPDLAERLLAAAPDGLDALLDCHGDGYVDLAVELWIPPDRVATIVDFEAADEHDVQKVFGYEHASPGVIAELAAMIEAGELTVPITATFSLDEVREAYERLAEGHVRGKVVLHVGAA